MSAESAKLASNYPVFLPCHHHPKFPNAPDTTYKGTYGLLCRKKTRFSVRPACKVTYGRIQSLAVLAPVILLILSLIICMESRDFAIGN